MDHQKDNILDDLRYEIAALEEELEDIETLLMREKEKIDKGTPIEATNYTKYHHRYEVVSYDLEIKLTLQEQLIEVIRYQRCAFN